MKKFFSRLYTLLRLYPTSLTNNDDLQALLKKLRPMVCDKKLIRVGPKGDGGYLIPDDLLGIAACFSPGVDYVSGFEKDCAERGMKVFMADYSVEGPAEEHDLFYFTKKYIGVINDENHIRLEDWINSSISDPDADLILQMDIEGAEYEVLLGLSENLLKRFRIIVVEFHSLKNMWSEPFFNVASKAFDKLLQTHVCVHNHPNNANPSKTIGRIEMPKTTEMTFLRKDRITESSYASEFPHPLDCDNTGKRTLCLPECWYR